MKQLQTYNSSIFMILVSLLILFLSITMKRQDITDPAGGSFLPAVISIIMLLAGIITLMKTKKNNDNDAEQQKKNEHQLSNFVTAFVYVMLIIGYVLLLPYLKFLLSSFFFLVGSMFFLKGVPLKKNLIISLITVIIIYFIFQHVFHIVFP